MSAMSVRQIGGMYHYGPMNDDSPRNVDPYDDPEEVFGHLSPEETRKVFIGNQKEAEHRRDRIQKTLKESKLTEPDGNVYRGWALGIQKGCRAFMLTLLVFLIQILAPIGVLNWARREFGGKDIQTSVVYFKNQTQGKDEWPDEVWQYIETKFLGLCFMLLIFFSLDRLLLRSDIQTDKLRLYFRLNDSLHKDAEEGEADAEHICCTPCPISTASFPHWLRKPFGYTWEQNRRRNWLIIDAFANCWATLFVIAALLPVFLSCEGIKDMVLDGFGLLFIAGLDDYSGDIEYGVESSDFDDFIMEEKVSHEEDEANEFAEMYDKLSKEEQWNPDPEYPKKDPDTNLYYTKQEKKSKLEAKERDEIFWDNIATSPDLLVPDSPDYTWQGQEDDWWTPREDLRAKCKEGNEKYRPWGKKELWTKWHKEHWNPNWGDEYWHVPESRAHWKNTTSAFERQDWKYVWTDRGIAWLAVIQQGVEAIDDVQKIQAIYEKAEYYELVEDCDYYTLSQHLTKYGVARKQIQLGNYKWVLHDTVVTKSDVKAELKQQRYIQVQSDCFQDCCPFAWERFKNGDWLYIWARGFMLILIAFEIPLYLGMTLTDKAEPGKDVGGKTLLSSGRGFIEFLGQNFVWWYPIGLFILIIWFGVGAATWCWKKRQTDGAPWNRDYNEPTAAGDRGMTSFLYNVVWRRPDPHYIINFLDFGS